MPRFQLCPRIGFASRLRHRPVRRMSDPPDAFKPVYGPSGPIGRAVRHSRFLMFKVVGHPIFDPAPFRRMATLWPNMTSERAAIQVFEEKHNMEILVFLLENGPCPKTDLYRGVSTNPRMPVKLAMLESIGLVRLEPSERFTMVSLTEKGEAVGRKFFEAIEIAVA